LSEGRRMIKKKAFVVQAEKQRCFTKKYKTSASKREGGRRGGLSTKKRDFFSKEGNRPKTTTACQNN